MKNKTKKTVQAQLTAQQGDVLLRKLDCLPTGEAKRTRGRLVLAHGESGHSHVIEAEDDATLIEIGDRMLLQLNEPATVVHEEHGPITLSPGIWEVGRVQEFDPFEQLTRNVAD
jgi:hypothetical protein